MDSGAELCRSCVLSGSYWVTMLNSTTLCIYNLARWAEKYISAIEDLDDCPQPEVEDNAGPAVGICLGVIVTCVFGFGVVYWRVRKSQRQNRYQILGNVSLHELENQEDRFELERLNQELNQLVLEFGNDHEEEQLEQNHAEQGAPAANEANVVQGQGQCQGQAQVNNEAGNVAQEQIEVHHRDGIVDAEQQHDANVVHHEVHVHVEEPLVAQDNANNENAFVNDEADDHFHDAVGGHEEEEQQGHSEALNCENSVNLGATSSEVADQSQNQNQNNKKKRKGRTYTPHSMTTRSKDGTGEEKDKKDCGGCD